MLGACALPELAKRKSFKWRTYPPDVLPASVAEMDFDVAEPIADAIRAALAIGDTGYPHLGELAEAFAEFSAARLGWLPDPARVFAIPDVMTGISEVLLATTPPGSGVVISPPVYGPYFLRIGYIGRPVIEAPLVPMSDGGSDLDADLLDQALARDGASAYLLCSPHNPLGRVWTGTELMTIADICLRRRVQLLVDEIHAPLVLPGAAFRLARPWLDAAIAQIGENHVLLAKLLGEQLPQVRYAPGSASFLAWLDCRALGLGDDPADAFLEHGRVALSSGPFFGTQGAGFARLNIGTSPELVAEAVRRMAAATAAVRNLG